MSRQGINKNEPGEFTPPLPTMLEQALELVSSEETINSLADSIGLSPEQLTSLLSIQKISPELITKMTPALKKGKVLRFVRK